MNEQTQTLPARPEIMNIFNASQGGARFEKMIKYDKGRYLCDGQQVPLGTKMKAHCVGWAMSWVKFQKQQLVDRKIYRVSKGETVADRETLGDVDKKDWEIGFNDLPKDPWVFQYLLPLEDVQTGERRIFVTPSVGGMRAVEELCHEYAGRCLHNPNCGQPIIKLDTGIMSSKKAHGGVQRPMFTIVGWDDGNQSVVEVPDDVMRKADFDDEIPF